jgi:hypothetical protein
VSFLSAAGLPLPAQHVAESWNAAEFFANKLLREFRGVSEAHVAWVQALKVSQAAAQAATQPVVQQQQRQQLQQQQQLSQRDSSTSSSSSSSSKPYAG